MEPAIRDGERRFLEQLRTRYEDNGFSFTAEPTDDQIPAFLGSYRPDALALKPGQNEVIEIKRRMRQTADMTMLDLRKRLADRPDWRLRVFHMGDDPLAGIEVRVVEPEIIRGHLREVRSLVARGDLRASFVLAWSLLEAALRSAEGGVNQPREIGSVVQALAMQGLIAPETERRIRSLIGLRHRIVHGDLTVAPTAADVEAIIGAVEETLGADSS